MQEQVEGPGQPGGGRLVAGEEEREQLIAHLGVGQALAVLILGEKQGREHILAFGQGGFGPPAGDLGKQDLVDGASAGLKAPRGATVPADPAAGQKHQHEQPARPGERLDHRAQTRAQDLLGGAGPVAKDDAHDDPQGERLHALQKRERLAHRPGIDLGIRRVANLLGVGLHPLAVKGRQHQPPLAKMLGSVEEQHRTLAEDRAEQGVGLAGVELLTRALEDLFDQRRFEHHHEARVEDRPERHRVAVPAPAGLEKPWPGEHEAGRLDEARQPRTGGKGVIRGAHLTMVAHPGCAPAAYVEWHA